MNIEKQSAHTLPDNMHQMVIKECREQVKTSGFAIFVFIITAAAFIAGGAMTVYISGWQASAISLMILFTAVPALVAYFSFVKPRKLLKKAEKGSYEYYIGRLTDKTFLPGDDTTYYQLVLDNAVKCSCTEQQYKKAQFGEEYMAIYFGSKAPEMCLEVIRKDII